MPLIRGMTERRRGQIALMSSLAAFRGFPGAPAYCASKAAVRSYGESLRGDAGRPTASSVSVICPGFVKTPMTAVNPFKMPFLMEAERAAASSSAAWRATRHGSLSPSRPISGPG